MRPAQYITLPISFTCTTIQTAGSLLSDNNRPKSGLNVISPDVYNVSDLFLNHMKTDICVKVRATETT